MRTTRANPAPLTDSSWFWVLVFALFGLMALLSVSGKYGRRQAGIERKFQARQRLQQADRENANQQRERPTTEESSDADATLIPLWPLVILLLAAAAVAAVMLGISSIAERGRHEET